METTPPKTSMVNITSSLEELQSDEQRRVLDTVTEVRKCGLEGILSLPQIVVCGDQSAGKSSVLEALTEIPFPRNDNLCTRFATEISLRREAVSRLTIKVIPDTSRPQDEQQKMKDFEESIADFANLPVVMQSAMKIMGIADDADSGSGAAFAKDTLSIEIEGPDRPQLTLVDIPGLIQTSTKGVTDADVKMVAEITDRYIRQPRTICLAVVSATNDAANQPILQRVRRFDPKGERTLGVITKPDRLPSGSGSESKFLELARNEDVFFKLGWHVIKNRSYEESGCSFAERNLSEMDYFRTSNFKTLPSDTVGIDALRVRLSQLLFEHVKNELPRLRDELENALRAAHVEIDVLGNARSTATECRAYMAQLSMDYYEICKAGLDGNYEHDYFKTGTDKPFSPLSSTSTARLRALVQFMNYGFSENFRKHGHKYHICLEKRCEEEAKESDASEENEESEESGGGNQEQAPTGKPAVLTRTAALGWVKKVLLRTRGKELIGNFNPLLIGELFWEQSVNWRKLSEEHIEATSSVCEAFLANLLQDKAPEDIKNRVWSTIMRDSLKKRQQAAFGELGNLIRDAKEFPINYNHYYTQSIQRGRQARMESLLRKAVPAGTSVVNVSRIASVVGKLSKPDMEEFSCDDALICLQAIYKVQHKTFVANVVTQVIERHIVRDLEKIFSPLAIIGMPDAEVEGIAAEPAASKRQRTYLNDRIRKLEDGRGILRGVMGSAVKAP